MSRLLTPLLWAVLHLRRALGGNLQTMPVTPHEQVQLEAHGVLDPSLQRFATWRKSVLLLVIPPTLLSAVLFTQRVANQGFELLSRTGATLVIIDALTLYLLPLAALAAAYRWTNHQTSHKLLFRGWLIVFLFPIVYAFLPIPWQFNLSGIIEDREVERNLLEGYGMFLGLAYYLALMPTVMSLMPGLIRACVRMKSLMPAFIVPGWFLMAAAPLYLVLWLVVFVVINRVAGNALLILGVLLWIGAPMIYVIRADTFLRPLDTREGGRLISRVQFIVNTCLLVGIVLLVIYGLTKKILGIPLLGLREETSFIYMVQQGTRLESGPHLEFKDNPESILWIGDLHIYRYFLEYMGRSLFMTVIFADLLIRVELTVWKQEHDFFQTAAAADYDRLMGDLGQVYGTRLENGESKMEGGGLKIEDDESNTDDRFRARRS